MKFEEFIKKLESKIQESYEVGVTMEVSEKLAAEFLHAQMIVSTQLKNIDLDSRMRKTGLKAVRAAVYADAASKGDKKPTEAALSAIVDMSGIVQTEQEAFDKAEVNKCELERLYDVFLNAHIYFRGVAKGKFE